MPDPYSGIQQYNKPYPMYSREPLNQPISRPISQPPSRWIPSRSLILIVCIITLVLTISVMAYSVASNMNLPDDSARCSGEKNIPECIGRLSSSTSICDSRYQQDSPELGNCYIGAAIAEVSTKPCIKLRSREMSNLCISRIAYDNHQYKICNDLKKLKSLYKEKTTEMVDLCLLNFPVFVEDWNDPAVCEWITDEILKERCRSFANRRIL